MQNKNKHTPDNVRINSALDGKKGRKVKGWQTYAKRHKWKNSQEKFKFLRLNCFQIVFLTTLIFHNLQKLYDLGDM